MKRNHTYRSNVVTVSSRAGAGVKSRTHRLANKRQCSGSHNAKFPHLRQFSPMKRVFCFRASFVRRQPFKPTSAWRVQSSNTRYPAVVKSIFDSDRITAQIKKSVRDARPPFFALHLLNKIQIANCDCFPTTTVRRSPSRAVQRLVDARKRVNQDIVRDHEGALRSSCLLEIESEVQNVQPLRGACPEQHRRVQFVGSSRFGSTPILSFPRRGERCQARCSDMLPLFIPCGACASS
jgi:hypothetical protein